MGLPSYAGPPGAVGCDGDVDDEVDILAQGGGPSRPSQHDSEVRPPRPQDGDMLFQQVVPSRPSQNGNVRVVPLSEPPEIPSENEEAGEGRREGSFWNMSMEETVKSLVDRKNKLRNFAEEMRRSVVWGEQKNSDSCMGRLEEHPVFQNTTLGVIVLNAVWIAIDTQWNHKSLTVDGVLPLEPYSTAIENIFCLYFFTEVVVRFIAFRRKIFCLRDAWFVFDCTLVMLMVLETWVMPLVQAVTVADNGANTGMFSSMRLLRLLRLTRMARLMRFFPELMTLVKGMISATQAVGFILLFLIIVTYIFAILFTVQLGSPPDPNAPEPEEGADPTAKELFCDLGSSMMTLFTNGVLGDNLYSTLVIIKTESVLLMWAFILFFFISSMTLLNMLIGVLCAVIEETAKQEFEAHQVYELRTTLKRAFDAVDSSRDGTISADEWYEIRNNPDVRSMFEGLGIDPTQLDTRLDQLQETVFGRMKSTTSGAVGCKSDKAGLGFEEFMERVVDLKWGTAASALDLESLKAQVLAQDKDLRSKLGNIEKCLGQLLGQPSSSGCIAASEDASDAQAQALGGMHSARSRPVGPLFGGSGGEQPIRPEDLPRPQTPLGSPGALIEQPASPAPPTPFDRPQTNLSAPTSGADWLQEVPTELLFHVLKLRSPPKE